MKFIDDIKRRLYIKYVQKCKHNTHIWMKQYGYHNISEVKLIGYNNLPDYVIRYIVSVASIDELIKFINPFHATYVQRDYVKYFEWNVELFGTMTNNQLISTIKDAICNYSYKRQYAFFIKLLGTIVSNNVCIRDFKYSYECNLDDYKIVSCNPLLYKNGKLILELINTLRYRNALTGKGDVIKVVDIRTNSVCSTLMHIYIDMYIDKIPFPSLIDNISSSFGVYSPFGTHNHQIFVDTCCYLGYTRKTMININCATALSNYQPNMVSLSDYVLKHLRDVDLYKCLK